MAKATFLKGACEGNNTPVGQIKEHLTSVWDLLGSRSRDNVRAARKEAKKSLPTE